MKHNLTTSRRCYRNRPIFGVNDKLITRVEVLATRGIMLQTWITPLQEGYINSHKRYQYRSRKIYIVRRYVYSTRMVLMLIPFYLSIFFLCLLSFFVFKFLATRLLLNDDQTFKMKSHFTLFLAKTNTSYDLFVNCS